MVTTLILMQMPNIISFYDVFLSWIIQSDTRYVSFRKETCIKHFSEIQFSHRHTQNKINIVEIWNVVDISYRLLQVYEYIIKYNEMILYAQYNNYIITILLLCIFGPIHRGKIYWKINRKTGIFILNCFNYIK